MKNRILSLCFGLALTLTSSASYFDLVSFGNTAFTVDPDATTANYTQSSSALNFSPSISLADTIGGSFNAAPFDWSTYISSVATAFAVKISIVSGSNPNLPFSLSLVNAGGDILNFVGTTVGATTDTYIALTLNATDPGNPLVLNGVTAGQFTWDGGAPSANVSLQSVAAVPEPSTYALLVLGGLALSGYALRRRTRA